MTRGRPPSDNPRKVNVSVRFTKDEEAALDERRGYEDRSAYIRRKALGGPKPRPPRKRKPKPPEADE